MTIDFTYHVPTRIYFGEDIFQHLGAELKKYGHNVLLLYGSERLKKLPLYRTIREQTSELTLFEVGGVEPNPRHTTVNKAAALCKEHHIDVLLAVGGGSVIVLADCVSRLVHG